MFRVPNSDHCLPIVCIVIHFEFQTESAAFELQNMPPTRKQIPSKRKRETYLEQRERLQEALDEYWQHQVGIQRVRNLAYKP